MLIRTVAAVVLSCCAVALCAQKEEQKIGFETVILYDVQGLWGGRDVYINKDGDVHVQTVNPPTAGKAGLQAKRFTLRLVPEQLAELDQLLSKYDWNAKVKERLGIPDEHRPHIFVRWASQGESNAAKWGGERRENFDQILAWLQQVAEDAQKQKLLYEGPYDPNWQPAGLATQREMKQNK